MADAKHSSRNDEPKAAADDKPVDEPNRQDNTPPLDAATAKRRDAEIKRQRDVVDAVHAATHDKAGHPIPIVPPGTTAGDPS